MRIKVLSLWQPWATLMANGDKTIETRHWSTNYRGPLAIHAAKRIVPVSEGVQAYERLAVRKIDPASLPRGAVVVIVDLLDVVPVEELSPWQSGGLYHVTKAEQALGNYAPGRYAWITRLRAELPEPIPLRGSQGLFTWDWQKG